MSPSAEKYARATLRLRRAEDEVRVAKMILADAARELARDGVSLPHSVLMGNGVCVTITKDLGYSLRDSQGHSTDIPVALVGGLSIPTPD